MMPISEKVLRQRAWADKQIQEKWQREADARPDASLARKMRLRDKPLLSDATRGATSPLGGIAVQTKPQRRGRR
jgi:hypothetical protein